MEKGKAVKGSDPWAYCRNAACEQMGKDQSGAGEAHAETEAAESTEEAAEEAPKPAPAKKTPAKPAAKKAAPAPAPAEPEESTEGGGKSDVYKKQYGRIVKKLASATQGDEAAKNIISLCLSVVKAEDGAEAANEIINELELSSLGIDPLTDDEG
jgi:hypothetical protein